MQSHVIPIPKTRILEAYVKHTPLGGHWPAPQLWRTIETVIAIMCHG